MLQRSLSILWMRPTLLAQSTLSQKKYRARLMLAAVRKRHSTRSESCMVRLAASMEFTVFPSLNTDKGGRKRGNQSSNQFNTERQIKMLQSSVDSRKQQQLTQTVTCITLVPLRERGRGLH